MPNERQRPFSIRIFVPDGDPDGLRLIEKSNWTGIGVVFNRPDYKQVVSRSEFDRTGVYVLVGNSENSALPTVYIGEGDPVKDRLNAHYGKRDFWEWAVFFVTKDNSLNKAHVQRMECELINRAKDAKQCKLDNGNLPSPPTLSEAEVADVESFVVDMLSIFPLIGLSIFERVESQLKPRDLLFIDAKGVKAKGYEGSKGFVVCAGSELVKTETPTIPTYVSTLRKDLCQSGVTFEAGQLFRFTEDYAFSSPSMASSVVLGRSSNGRTNWKSADGRTLKEIQEATAASEE